MHLAIGHYSIGSNDGVNTVLWRTVNEMQYINPDLRITLFGQAAPAIDRFLPWKSGKLMYRNIEELSPDYCVPGLESKNVQIQRVHDYIWHGTNVAERLQQQFADADVILMENLSIGINPAVTYAFHLWSLWEYQAKTDKRFFIRVHDFAQQRPANFGNIKKFQAFLPTDMPDWHQILYPSTPNVEYISINTTDYYRLIDHGIEPRHIWYVPNSIDNSLVRNRRLGKSRRLDPARRDNSLAGQLRLELETKKNVDPEAAILFYPVRAIPRKNVEEAIYLTQLLNNLAKLPDYRQKYDLDPSYHLIISLNGGNEEERRYARTIRLFVEENHLPVTIDISDIVGLHREYDPEDPQRIVKYGVVDMYDVARMAVSTSLLEGFGFVFIEPWAAEQCIIGRNIPSVTMDFIKAGLSLDHLYSALLVNGHDYADIGTDEPDHGLQLRLREIKKLDDTEYLLKVFFRNNASLRATLRLFRRKNRRTPYRSLVSANHKKVLENYSNQRIVSMLNRIMLRQEPAYNEPRLTSAPDLDSETPDNLQKSKAVI